MDIVKLFKAGEANLNNLIKGESDLFISKAIQKAFIDVNEEGAEAAAANGESNPTTELRTVILTKQIHNRLLPKDAIYLFSSK